MHYVTVNFSHLFLISSAEFLAEVARSHFNVSKVVWGCRCIRFNIYAIQTLIWIWFPYFPINIASMSRISLSKSLQSPSCSYLRCGQVHNWSMVINNLSIYDERKWTLSSQLERNQCLLDVLFPFKYYWVWKDYWEIFGYTKCINLHWKLLCDIR